MSTMNDAFEKETLQPLDVAITSVVRQTTHLIADARHLRKMLEAAQTPVEATPVESQRERNGRLFWEALYPKEPWSLTYPETREKYMNGAERFIAAAQPPSDETEATPVESERERKGRLLFEIMDDDQCYRWKDIGASTQIYWITVAEQFVTQCQAKPDYTALRTWLNEQNNEAVDRWYLRQQDHLPFTLRVTAPMPEEVHAYQKVWAWLDEHEAHHE